MRQLPPQQLERLAREIGSLEALIQQQPVPENDRMTQRYRQEAPTLKALIHYDEQLVGQCDLLRSMVNKQDGSAILARFPDLEGGLEAIRATLQSAKRCCLIERCRWMTGCSPWSRRSNPEAEPLPESHQGHRQEEQGE